MKYTIGTIVILNDEKNVYITGFDDNTKKYKGFDVKDSMSKEDIIFSEHDVLMKA